MNRETWLTGLVKELEPFFHKHDAALPTNLRISCGWPSKKALARKGRVIGQCWYPVHAEDKSTQIFISPVLSEGIDVAETTLHELVHAAVGSGHGHRGPFVRLAKSIGFTAPWTSTPSTDELKSELNKVLDIVGPYPHGKLDAAALSSHGGPKQTTRLIKVTCVACGCPIRMTRTWIDEQGTPTCACGGVMEIAA